MSSKPSEPTRWTVAITKKGTPDVGLVHPVKGQVVAVQAVCIVKTITAHKDQQGRVYKEAVLDPLELVVTEDVRAGCEPGSKR